MLQILAWAHACGLRIFPKDNRTLAILRPIPMNKMDDVYCDLLWRQIATAIT